MLFVAASDEMLEIIVRACYSLVRIIITNKRDDIHNLK